MTLVLYFGYKRRWDKPLTLHEALDVTDLFRPFVPDMKVNLFEIAYLSHEQVNLFRSDFRIVADYFVQMRENGDYTPSPDKLDHIQAVLQLLNVMTQDRRFEEAYNDATNKGEVRNMCEWLDRVENRSIARGRAEGLAQGITQGKVEGAEEQAKKTAMNLKSMGLSPADIARAIDRSLSVVQQWLGAEMT